MSTRRKRGTRIRKGGHRRRSRRARVKMMMGGTCNCQAMAGGSANLANLAPDYKYEYNSQIMAPPLPSYGGKGKRRRKMQGGGLLEMASGFGGTNQVDVFGTSLGAYNMSGMLAGTPFTNASPHVQPIEAKYGSHNMPLV